MLKDDKEVALHELLVTCRKVADDYRQADGLVEDPPLDGDVSMHGESPLKRCEPG
jgi:hypothetical protein